MACPAPPPASLKVDERPGVPPLPTLVDEAVQPGTSSGVPAADHGKGEKRSCFITARKPSFRLM